MILYARFKLTVGFKKINEIMKSCGFNGDLCIKNSHLITLKINSKVPLTNEEKTIIEKGLIGLNLNDDLTIIDAKFDGYRDIVV